MHYTLTHPDAAPARHTDPTAAHLIRTALSRGYTLTADAPTGRLTLTNGTRTITLAPTEEPPKLTTAQRRTLLALAAAPDAPLWWEYSSRNVPHLVHGEHRINRAVSMSLLDAGMITGVESGHRSALTLAGHLAIGRLHDNSTTLAAALRTAYSTT